MSATYSKKLKEFRSNVITLASDICESSAIALSAGTTVQELTTSKGEARHGLTVKLKSILPEGRRHPKGCWGLWYDPSSYAVFPNGDPTKVRVGARKTQPVTSPAGVHSPEHGGARTGIIPREQVAPLRA